MKKIKSNRFYIFFSQYFTNKWPTLIIFTFIIILGVAAGSLNPFIYGKILDEVIVGQMEIVVRFLAIYFSIGLITVLSGLLENYFGQIISFSISSIVRKNIFRKIIYMRVSNLEKYPKGELISRLDSDADVVVNYYIDVISNIALIIFNLFASIYFVFTISTRLSLIAIFYIPASTAVNIIFRKKLRGLEKKQRLYFDGYMSFINEAFNNIHGIRSYIMEGKSEKKFTLFIKEKLELIKKSIRLSNSISILSHIISSIFQFATLYYSAKFIIEGTLTIGSMVAFNTYIGKLYNVVSRILSMNMSAQGVIVSMERMEELRNEPDEHEMCNHMIDLKDNITGLYIKNINFNYKEEVILNNLTMQCEKPGLYAIVGKNGSGKSTLFKILMGFYDYEGQIILRTDNVESYSLKNINLVNLRRKINYISKDIFILNDTLLNNLKIANPDLAENDIIKTCNQIGYNNFITTLPEQYETILSENGNRFSSGQKQKLSTIRAYLSNSDIILLDEITSDLDGIAENEILALINELAKTRIVLFVSHKITSIMNSKHIFLFDEGGSIIDEGKHNELIERSELYRGLFWLEKKTESFG